MTSPFTACSKIFEIGVQNAFVYRWNFLMRSLFGLVPLAGTYFIWHAIFEQRQANIGGYEFGAMIFYFMMVILVENLVTPTEDEWQIAADIRDGNLNSILVKPMNYLVYRGTLFASYRVLYTCVTLIPVAGVFWWFREYLTIPSDAMTWVWTLASVIMAAILQFLIAYTLGLIAFWLLEISTIVFITYSLEYFFGGHLFPIDIMPEWFQSILKWLPFQYELYFPVSIFMQRVQGAELYIGLMIQAMWVLILFTIANLVWRVGLRRYQAVGG